LGITVLEHIPAERARPSSHVRRAAARRRPRKHGYPPDKQARATELVLEQAEGAVRALGGRV